MSSEYENIYRGGNKLFKLSLVVPCYNEENNVIPFFNLVTESFLNYNFEYEIIFIDDGSKDFTFDKIKYLSNKHRNIYYLKFSRNFGKEAAMYAGLEKTTGDYISIIDADLQQHPNVILEMLEILETNKNLDCVAAYQENRKESSIIKFLKKNFYNVINKISDVNLYNGASDFRTMRRNMVDSVLKLTEYHRFSKGIFSWVGLETHYMPYSAEKRNSGVSKWSVINLFKYAFEGIIAFSTAPLKISLYLGILMSLLSLIYMVVVIFQKLFFYIPVQGYTTIIVLILLLGGIQLFILGIIGEYISKIYIQGKNRPIYLVKEGNFFKDVLNARELDIENIYSEVGK